MDKSYIVSVLDHCFGEVDIFKVSVPEEIGDDDIYEYLEEEIENREHHLSNCSWMFSQPEMFRIKMNYKE